MTDEKIEEKLKKIKKLIIDKNGQIDEELKKEIKELTLEKTKKNTSNIVSNLNNFSSLYDSDKIISSLSEIQQPEIVKESIKKTISSLLDPLRTSFMTEIARYVDSISIEENIIKEIPRVILSSQTKIIENGVFKSLGETQTISEDNKYVTNPEFKQLLSTGYKPKDSIEYQKNIKDLSSLSDSIGTPESDYIKNTNGEFLENIENKKEIVSGTINKPAALFINSFDELYHNTKYVDNNEFKQIILNGYSILDKNTKNKKYKVVEKKQNPDWIIDYKESGPKYTLKINSSSSYSFIGKVEDILSDQTKKYIENNLKDCESLNNDELYSEIITQNNLNIFTGDMQNNKNYLKNFFKLSHPKIFESLIGSFFSSYKNNRLLKKFKLPKIQGLEDSDVEKASNLIILNLINFIPEASEELLNCGKQPHPLNLDQIIDLMIKKFNSIGTQIIPKDDFLQNEPKNAITEASKLGSCILLMRLVILENILKSLLVFDEHQYSNELIMGDLYTDFVYIKIVELLNKQDLYNEFENVIIDNYQFLKDNNIVKEEDEVNSSNIESIRINGESFEQENLQFKHLTKSLIRKTITYIKNLIGTIPTTKEEEKFGLLELLTNNKIYNIPEDQTILNEQSIQTTLERFNNIKENSFFILEKYVSINLNKMFKNSININNKTKLIERYSKYDGCISMSEYEKFIKEISKDTVQITTNNTVGFPNIEIKKIIEIIEYTNKPINLGLRLVQVFKKQSLPNIKAARINVINNEIYEFSPVINMNNKLDIKIKREFVKKKRMYGFCEYIGQEIKLYNSLLINESLISLTSKEINSDINDLFESKKTQLLNKIINDPKYDIILNKSLFLNKLPTLAMFYSNCALTNTATQNLFSISKKRIFDLYESSINVKNYKYKNSTEKMGGTTSKYQQDVLNIGNPSGGINFDILQFFITTPILILKGITNLVDPNISIASQIVNAAAAGLLFPTEDDNGNLQYPGEPFILPTVLASLALLPVNIFGFTPGPPVTPLPGMLYWALEPLLWNLPFFKNQAAKSSAAKKLKNDPSFRGLSIGGQDKFKCDIDQDE